MTRLYDDPDTFTEDMLAGFLNAHASYVSGVPGGVVRASETPRGKVAVVVGGGSGHYPAFCGVVGIGLADGAVVGNIFTSPSTQDAYSVAKAVAGNAGVLFITGNYGGDVMNFTLAADKLRGEGIDTRLLFVTDDLASAPASEAEKRRGIAGDFVVFKVAGAAAEEGYDLAEVERVARDANELTRSLGVAFGGCTLPGASAPLFTVPEGHMGVGLGIHGEPGISEDTLPPAADLAERLVNGVLAEMPPETDRPVGAILNGLGTTKYEELFVVWRTVAALLAERGITVVEPEVGELVTSLDMAGCSLTLVLLNDELERLWRAPADSPAYRKGAAHPSQDASLRRTTAPAREVNTASHPQGSPAAQDCAATAILGLDAMAQAIRTAEAELGRIDAVAGDGDHGRGMVKGVTAAVTAAKPVAEASGGVGSVLAAAGEAWAAKAGGTSGVLWGAALASIGDRLGDHSAAIPAETVAAALRAGLYEVQRLGKAELGDKTMIDSFAPFVEALESGVQAGLCLRQAWAEASEISGRAAQETASLRPKLGRARPLAERSVGTPDAGAISLAICARAVADVLART